MCLAQDIIRKTLGDELPDFYNIVLERPKDDPTGYDVLFIDAASKVGFHPSLYHLNALRKQDLLQWAFAPFC